MNKSKIYLLIPVIFISISANSQSSVYIGSAKHDAGQYYDMLYSCNIDTIGKHVISAGIKINDAIKYSDNFVRIGDIYPKSLSEYFGIKIQYQYFINNKIPVVHPYFFTALEYTKSTARSNPIYLFNLDSLVNPDPQNNYFISREDFSGPYHWFDARIGIGLQADLSKRIYLNFYASMGYQLHFGNNTYIDMYDFSFPSSSLSISGGIGIGYRFK